MIPHLAIGRRVPLIAAAAASVALWVQSPAIAQSLDPIVPSVEKCKQIGCNDSALITGRINGFGTLSNPWVGLFAAGDPAEHRPECLRVEVEQSNADLAITVIAPDGAVFTDDDSGSCSRCPLVVIDGIVQNAAFTVVVNSFSGSPIEENFVLRVGRYRPAGNPNCANPTPFAERTLAERLAKQAAGKK
jgi:hypothetical protein